MTDISSEKAPPRAITLLVGDREYAGNVRESDKDYEIPEWVHMFQPALQLVADHVTAGIEHRVFLKLLSVAMYGNEVRVCQSHLAAEMNVDRTSLNRAIAALCKLGVFIRVEKDGKNWIYKLNPLIGCKGTLSYSEKAYKAKHKRKLAAAGKKKGASDGVVVPFKIDCKQLDLIDLIHSRPDVDPQDRDDVTDAIMNPPKTRTKAAKKKLVPAE